MIAALRARVLSMSYLLRQCGLGALAGAVAGALFGLVAVLIQTAITRHDIARFGDAAVDHGAPFLYPNVILSLGLLGGFLGLAYAAIRSRQPWLAHGGGVVFAALLAVGLQPLLAGRFYISAVVAPMVSFTMPGGFVKSGPVIEDLLAPAAEVGAMAILVFLMGLAIHHLLWLASRLVPRLPLVVYVLICAVIGLPGLALFLLLFLLAIGAVGGE